MSDFLKALDKTLLVEGGTVLSKHDRGGLTYNGISSKWFPEWEGWYVVNRAIEHGNTAWLPRSPALAGMVAEFYKTKFWNLCGLDGVDNQAIAEEVFDTAVNQGVRNAAKYFQAVINLLNRNELITPDIDEDGFVGRHTLESFRTVYQNILMRYGQTKAEIAFVKALNGEQYQTYRAICRDDPSQEHNFLGWITKRL